MKHYVTVLCVFMATLITLFTMSIMTSAAKMTAYLKHKEEALVIARGAESLEQARKTLDEQFAVSSDEAADDAFDRVSTLLYNQNAMISKAEANEIFSEAFVNNLKKFYGVDKGTVSSEIEDMLPDVHTGDLSLNEDKVPDIKRVNDSVVIDNITVNYKYKTSYFSQNDYEMIIPIKEISLYDENPEVFTYSLIGNKGIYITGKTSTIFGNIYAGTHAPAELRSSEALYGEKDFYGGINIMSTQIAIEADKIVSEGNFNMKGSFVLVGGEEAPATLIARDVYQTDTLASKNMYGLIGNFEKLETLSDEKFVMMEAMKPFADIGYYYDSDNDKGYTGKYRKIISGTDVTLKKDVTGIVITPGSVIIEEGVNVEGLVISGDRIYVQGNNNIVSSVEVLRNMVKEELYENPYEAEITDDDLLSELDNIEEKSKSKLHLRVVDYLGGIERRGIKDSR